MAASLFFLKNALLLSYTSHKERENLSEPNFRRDEKLFYFLPRIETKIEIWKSDKIKKVYCFKFLFWAPPFLRNRIANLKHFAY